MSNEDEMIIELKKIREALEKAPLEAPKGLWNKFKDFLAKYNELPLTDKPFFLLFKLAKDLMGTICCDFYGF